MMPPFGDGPFGRMLPVMAENFGVSAASADNAPALRQALANGGRVTLTVPGTYAVGSTIPHPREHEVHRDRDERLWSEHESGGDVMKRLLLLVLLLVVAGTPNASTVGGIS